MEKGELLCIFVLMWFDSKLKTVSITCVTVSYCVCAQLIGAGEEGVKEKDPFVCQCFGTGDLLWWWEWWRCRGAFRQVCVAKIMIIHLSDCKLDSTGVWHGWAFACRDLSC